MRKRLYGGWLVSGFIILLFSFSFVVDAQILSCSGQECPFPVNESFLLGGEGDRIRESALTPGQRIPYTGGGIRFVAERFRLRSADGLYSTHTLLSGSLAFTSNPAGSASEIVATLFSVIAVHRRFHPDPALTLLVGPALHVGLSNIFNTRSSNNPDVFRLSLALSPSFLSFYRFYFFNYPLFLRAQMEIPLIGATLAPPYGQSYYELYGLGNTRNLVVFTAPHNRRSLLSILSLDVPAGPVILRLAATCQVEYYQIHARYSRHEQFAVLVGFVRESLFFGGRTWRSRRFGRSALY
ncbi:MAG: DUF3316 domain-containing protein [Tannerellaceae bacterium]|jgi:hypothetical protein|nr:DUF3316 domain-containing protein [Tannerellaceae bacterium]